MASQKSRSRPPNGGLRPLAIKLLVAGLLMVALPWALARATGLSSGGPMRAVGNMGWLLTVLAGLIYLVGGGAGQRSGRGPGGERHSTHPSGASQLSTHPPASRFSPSSRLAGADSEPGDIGTPPSVWSTTVFRVIEWRRFEEVLEAYFAQAGFVTSAKSHGPDGGVDIWLYSRHEPGVPVGLVHGKHWHGKKVAAAQIRDFMKVMAAHQMRRGLFATASLFTPDGADYARNHHVQPLDPKALVELIEQRTPEEQKALLGLALQGEYWRPTCWKCQVKLVQRDDADDAKPYWGCTNHPLCKTTMDMRRSMARSV